MAEIANLYRNSLFTQLHRQRSDHERCIKSSTLDRLNNCREVSESLRLETRRSAGTCRVVGNRASEMTRNWQEADLQLRTCLCLLMVALGNETPRLELNSR